MNELKDNDMLREIIRKLTKTEEGSDVTSELVLVWPKRVEAQKAQSTIIISLSETKDISKIKAVKRGQRQYEKKPQTYSKTPMSQSCRYCGSSHLSRECPVYGKECTE